MKDQWGQHTCRAPGCRIVIGKSRLMCPGHFYRVPKALRDELADVFRRWVSGEAGMVKVLRDVQQRCIDSLTEDGHATDHG